MTAHLDSTLSALADVTRREIVDELRRKPRRASDLADRLRTSRPAMSRHLKVLRFRGLVHVTSEGDARERVYHLRPEPFVQLRHWLESVEQFWTVQLDSFKHHVERTRRR